MNLIALKPKILAVGSSLMSVSISKPIVYKNLENLHIIIRLTNRDG